MATSGYHLGVDVGGTFTDFVLWDAASDVVWSSKLLTTPDSPTEAIFDGFGQICEEAQIGPHEIVRFVHATTLVGNAVIERKGARTALVATKGFRDVLQFRRELRYDLFDPHLQFPEPLVPRSLSYEVDERVDAEGAVHRAPRREEVEELAEKIAVAGVEAVAVSLLHSYLNVDHERFVADVFHRCIPEIHVSLSSEVLRQIREYERTSATAINAYVQPLVANYLDTLQVGLASRGCPAQVLIVTSAGGTVSVDVAKRLPILMVESGPAAGVVFASRLGQAEQRGNLVAFDMGGTTAKICIIRDGKPQIRNDLEVARTRRFKIGSGLPIGIPIFDLLEIGAGGGSIAEVDPTGLINVGPRSAGAAPGPACYGRGGLEPTVTDANLCLGYLEASAFLGGSQLLDLSAAEKAIADHLSKPTGLSTSDAAFAVYRIVTETMAEALRVRSAESNVDIRRFTMMAFGGAAGVHAVDVARRLGIERIVCPPRAGVFSAAGLLVTPTSVEVLRSRITALSSLNLDIISSIYGELEAEARKTLWDGTNQTYDREFSADMSYVGQEYELHVPFIALPLSTDEIGILGETFENAYREFYGRSLPGFEKRIVTWRFKLTGPRPAIPTLVGKRAQSTPDHRRIRLLDGWTEVPVYNRRSIQQTDVIYGPSVVQDVDTTFLLPAATRLTSDLVGNLLIDCHWEGASANG